MSIIELKKVCHILIEQVEDKKFLEDFLETYRNRDNPNDTDWWNGLTNEQKIDLEEAWLESEDDNNLVSHEEVMRQIQKWLNK